MNDHSLIPADAVRFDPQVALEVWDMTAYHRKIVPYGAVTDFKTAGYLRKICAILQP